MQIEICQIHSSSLFNNYLCGVFFQKGNWHCRLKDVVMNVDVVMNLVFVEN